MKKKKTSIKKTKTKPKAKVAKKPNGQQITPLGDRVLVQEIIKETTTASGIILPDSVKDESGMKEAKVIAVGDGRIENGKKITINLKKGDTVLFQWGEKLTIEGVDYFIVNENQIVAKVS